MALQMTLIISESVMIKCSNVNVTHCCLVWEVGRGYSYISLIHIVHLLWFRSCYNLKQLSVIPQKITQQLKISGVQVCLALPSNSKHNSCIHWQLHLGRILSRTRKVAFWLFAQLQQHKRTYTGCGRLFTPVLLLIEIQFLSWIRFTILH